MAAAIPLLSRCTYGSTPGRLDGPAYLSGAGMLEADPIDLLRAYVAVRVEVEGRPAAAVLDDLAAALDRAVSALDFGRFRRRSRRRLPGS